MLVPDAPVRRELAYALPLLSDAGRTKSGSCCLVSEHEGPIAHSGLLEKTCASKESIGSSGL